MAVLVDIYTRSKKIKNGMYILKYNINCDVHVMLVFTEYDSFVRSFLYVLVITYNCNCFDKIVSTVLEYCERACICT